MMMRIESYVLGSIGTNCYLVWDEESGEAMLIDPSAYEAAIDRKIAENGLELKYVFLTHGHFDHIGGVSEFLESNPDALLVANEADDEMLDGLKPDVYMLDEDLLMLGRLSFYVLGAPGHTPGGLCLYTSESDPAYIEQPFSGTVFTGDTLFQTSVGRTDLRGGDFGTLKASIREKLFTLPDDTLVLPGHMGPTTIGDEKKFNPFVK
jgi:glyoxylase-like metal-dependent hydrolase (beta-lactamase superfamily II)